MAPSAWPASTTRRSCSAAHSRSVTSAAARGVYRLACRLRTGGRAVSLCQQGAQHCYRRAVGHGRAFRQTGRYLMILCSRERMPLLTGEHTLWCS